MSSQPNITLNDENTLTAIVSLGSNLASDVGNPLEIIRLAAIELGFLSSQPPILSTLYFADPVDCSSGTPVFINAVEVIYPEPQSTPLQLLQQLQQIEVAFGRNRGGTVNEPRSLDLDLICFGDCQINEPGLKLPHPDAYRRRFVLQPIADLAPSLVLPGQVVTVQELLATLPPEPAVVPIFTA